ncbi:hypothetical protein Tco_1429106 [Tanacetum coccineum]
MCVRPQTPILLPSEAEVERLLALTIPHHPYHRVSSPLPPIPSPPLPPLPSSLHLPPPVPTSLPLPSSSLPATLSVPLPVDHRKDTPEAEFPPRKRLCLTTPTSRNKVEESSTAAPRPTGGNRADYGFHHYMDNCQWHWDRFRHFRLEIRLMQMIMRALNNMPPRRSFATAMATAATARAAAATTAATTPMTTAAVE